MAQPIMHLLIADEIYKSNIININSYGNFLLGSIAPDAVHVIEDYTRGLKDLSHYNFNSNSQFEHFNTFLKIYKTIDNEDFVVGYLIHLLSDMVWYHSVRIPFEEKFAKDKSQNMSMNEAYYFDCEQIDYLLRFDNKVLNIFNNLNNSTSYTLDGLIEAKNVEIWKKQLLIKYKGKEIIEFNPIYVSEHQIRNYILQCRDTCLNYLRNVILMS